MALSATVKQELNLPEFLSLLTIPGQLFVSISIHLLLDAYANIRNQSVSVSSFFFVSSDMNRTFKISVKLLLEGLYPFER